MIMLLRGRPRDVDPAVADKGQQFLDSKSPEDPKYIQRSFLEQRGAKKTSAGLSVSDADYVHHC